MKTQFALNFNRNNMMQFVLQILGSHFYPKNFILSFFKLCSFVRIVLISSVEAVNLFS